MREGPEGEDGMIRMLLAALALCAPQVAFTQVDLDRFLKRDRYETIKISPDGRHYAATIPMEDRTGLAIIRRADMTMVSRAVGVPRSAVADFWWVSNDRLVIAMAQSMGSKDPLYVTGELHGLGIDAGRVKVLFGRPMESGIVERYGAVEPAEHATLLDPLPNDPDHALVAVWSNVAEPRTRVARMDVHGGRLTTVAHAPVARARFMVDAAGQVRFARGADASNASKLYYREHDRAEWRLVNDETVTGRVAMPLGMAPDGTSAYVRVEQASGPDAIEMWDMASGARTRLQADDVVDPYSMVYGTDMRTPVGAQYMRDGLTLRLFDQAGPMAALYRGLERAFAGSAFQVTSFTSDGSLALVRTWSDRVAGDYFLYDVGARHARGIYALRDWLPADEMAPTRAISLQARDGVKLHGYLAVPTGSSAPLPLVVLPHGGPFGVHEEWGFDTETQVLAAAGYAVLRLDFRGSGNYGRAFQLLGARQWGGTMQDDLTDATRWWWPKASPIRTASASTAPAMAATRH
jgi:dipeptidyl aminopeptidase/acylaminoacyl peptidase